MHVGNIGSSELLLILVLALLLLGPRRLPEVGASLGRMLRRFRQASRDLRTEMDVDRVLRLDDDDLPPATPARAATEPRQSAARAAEAESDPVSPSAAPATPATPAAPPTPATPGRHDDGA
jgi:TatA/E family protein of Tat protein translocase